MGQALIDRHFGHQVKDKETFQDSDVYYRLLDDDDSSALNAGDLSDCEPRAGMWALSYIEFMNLYHYINTCTVELQWLEHLWDYENVLETRVVRATEGLL